MRRRTLALIVAGAVIVVALVVGVVTAGAQGPSSLPSITVSQLLQNVATKAQGTTAISGDVAWTNGLLGGASSLLSLAATRRRPVSRRCSPAGRAGSGRRAARCASSRRARTATSWRSRRRHDLDLGLDDHDRHAATRCRPRAGARVGSPAPSPETEPRPGDGHRAAHPEARAARDAQRRRPGDRRRPADLHADAHARPRRSPASVRWRWPSTDSAGCRCGCRSSPRATARAVLSAGFKTVSFAPISDSLFTFTPPSGATVVHKNVSAAQQPRGHGRQGGRRERRQRRARHKPLTLAQAKVAGAVPADARRRPRPASRSAAPSSRRRRP